MGAVCLHAGLFWVFAPAAAVTAVVEASSCCAACCCPMVAAGRNCNNSTNTWLCTSFIVAITVCTQLFVLGRSVLQQGAAAHIRQGLLFSCPSHLLH